ncbi:MAG: AAA family ATPase [Thermodesulfobacteriota bacterium]
MPDHYGRDIYLRIQRNIETVIRGQTAAIRLLLAALAGGGHVLLDDYPGTGKTTLAKTLALSVDSGYKRIQFTPDLLPSDILGVSIYDQNLKAFHFHQGPIFTNILLADEINRASPRTQSALLESMAEYQVSIDGKRHPLADLFFVIATQNPVESRGTYPLPEAQMDRFTVQFHLGYVTPDQEVEILSDHRATHPLETVRPCATMADVLALQKQAGDIRITEELKRYIVDIVRSTRTAKGVALGASPRASLALMKTAQALALFEGIDYVTPEFIQEMAVSVIAHRMVIDPQATFSGVTAAEIVKEIMRTLPVPA